MITNSSMRALIADPAFAESAPAVPPDVDYIEEGGWTIGPGGTLLLAALWTGQERDIPVAEITRFEYEINDVHVSLKNLRGEGAFLPRAAARAVHFALHMLEKARGLPGSATLHANVAISVDTGDELFPLQGGVVRFFTQRGDPLGWLDDLERFKLEAIALLDMSDILQGRGD